MKTSLNALEILAVAHYLKDDWEKHSYEKDTEHVKRIYRAFKRVQRDQSFLEENIRKLLNE